MSEIRIEMKDEAVQTALNDLAGKVKNLRPIMKIIGDYMLKSTWDRFNKGGPAPDGTPWKPVKRPSPKARGILRVSDHLRDSIRYQLLGSSAVAVGTNRDLVPYAAIHQLGGTITQGARSELIVRNRYVRKEKKGQFKKGTSKGRGFTFKERKITIPARPYLGVSEKDSSEILGLIDRYLIAR